MKPIDQYKTLNELSRDLEADSSRRVPLKVMGKERRPDTKRNRHGTFYSISMLSYMYNEFPDPDESNINSSNLRTPVGQLLKSGIRMESYLTYSKINPNKNGNNLFQGDILSCPPNIDIGIGTQYVMLVSHSCDLANNTTTQVCPVYLEKMLEADTNIINQLRGKTLLEPSIVLRNWLTNENKSFLGLPPMEWEDSDQCTLVDLRCQYPIKIDLLGGQPKVRLTYRALSYLQARIAILYMRDVYDSDESRDI